MMVRVDGVDLERDANGCKSNRMVVWDLRVVRVPLVEFVAEVKHARVLEINWKRDALVVGLARNVEADVPRVQTDNGELELARDQMEFN